MVLVVKNKVGFYFPLYGVLLPTVWGEAETTFDHKTNLYSITISPRLEGSTNEIFSRAQALINTGLRNGGVYSSLVDNIRNY